jgi:hypothetical protein
MTTAPITPTTSSFLLYSSETNSVKIEVFVHDETIWLTQKKMSELFGVDVKTVSEHLLNIYKSGELQENSTVRKFQIVQNEGGREVNREVNFYNLDAIISLGYKVNSPSATQFRIWATTQLRELMVKGFVMDDERLKSGRTTFGVDYFRELLERIRSIRASERRIWLQITDIFKECSTDYNSESETAKEFFATIQNKFHFAITGHTAAEIVMSKADHNLPKMGLTTYKNSPKGRVLKSDVVIAKNYLEEKEVKALERTVSSFFDYIEGILERQTDFDMDKFALSVNKFLEFNEYKVLEGKGGVSHKAAETKAHQEYDVFNKTQKIDSDFEKFVLNQNNHSTTN